MTQHPFDQAIELSCLAREGDTTRWAGATTESYWNMIGPFGGTTASLIMQSLLSSPQRSGDPISLTLTYASAVRQGEFEIVTHLVSATRSTQHWSVQLAQGPDRTVAVNAIAMFATRRDTWAASEARMPDVPPAEACEVFQQPPGVVPWLHNYTFRVLQGNILQARSGQASEDSTSTLWVSDKPPRPLDFASLTSYCDAFFPRIYLRRGQIVPAGTVSLNIYFHATSDRLAQLGSAPLLCTARGLNYGGGFFDQNAQIWSPDGFLLANTQQMVWYKE